MGRDRQELQRRYSMRVCIEQTFSVNSKATSTRESVRSTPLYLPCERAAIFGLDLVSRTHGIPSRTQGNSNVNLVLFRE